jgi:hypothetical protein
VALAALPRAAVPRRRRVDLRCTRDGTLKFIEANPLPGLNPGWSDLCVLAERRAGATTADRRRFLTAALARLGIGAGPRVRPRGGA